MLVEAAIGDSFGAGVEARSDEKVQTHIREMVYRQHQKWTEMTPGWYTDDTQMAIALSEFLLSGKPITMLNWADAVVETFQRDPRPGYAQGFYAILQQTISGNNLLGVVQPHSRKNGGAMRAFPLGLLKDASLVIDRAMFQASLTHATMDGMLAAAASALMTHYFYHDIGKKRDLPHWLEDQLGVRQGHWLTVKTHTTFRATIWEGRVGFDNGKDTIAAVVSALTTGGSMTGILKEVVGFGGDTDTTATIAMAAASFSKEVAQDLPKSLYDGLEDGPYGLRYLERLDMTLRREFPAEGVNALPPDPVGAEGADGIIDLFPVPSR